MSDEEQRRRAMSTKRLNYFNHQFLDEHDFRDEQQYHLAMRRHHHRALHSSGVIEGLQVSKSGSREITVQPGAALDREGREVILEHGITRELKLAESHQHIHVVLSYGELFDKADLVGKEIEGYNRVTEFAELSLVHEQEKAATGVLLGTIHVDSEGNIIKIDHSSRQMAGSLIAPAAVHTVHLADGTVTRPKLSPELLESLKPGGFAFPDGSVTWDKLSPDLQSTLGVRGWVRLPFRPGKLKAKQVNWGPGAVGAEGDFNLDVEFAHCDAKGAKGSMGIPVPPGASHVREFRIAGTTRQQVRVQLLRTGWNIQERKGESTPIINEELRNAVFDQKLAADRELDEYHTLTVSIHATGESEIWLVAARFE
jgi:hypothetical protein